MSIATKRKILIATLIALALVAGLLVWYFSALTHYRLSLNKRYSYHLTYHSTAKTAIILPKVEAQTNSGETTCEMKWDIVPRTGLRAKATFTLSALK